MMRILIVKMSSLGDIIHAFPVLHFIKDSHPHAEIDWVVEYPFVDLVQAHPLVNRVICVQTKKWRSQYFKNKTWKEIAQFRSELRHSTYQLVLDLQGNVKSGLVTGLAKSKMKVGFGYPYVSEWPNLLTTHQHYHPPTGKNIREDYLFIAQHALGNFSPIIDHGIELKLNAQEKIQLTPILKYCQQLKGLKIMVCPGSNWPNKQVDKKSLQSFLHLLTREMEVHFLLLWGHSAEKAMAEELANFLPQHSSVVSKLSLPALQNLMSHVDLVIAMDSLPLHLAGTTSTPTYSIFGASSADKYKPIGKQHQAFQGLCPYSKSFEKRCDVLRTCQTGACIKQIEGEQLFKDFFKWWLSFKATIK